MFLIYGFRLIYEHLGDETLSSDKAYLIAESLYEKQHIPLWLTFSIIAENNHLPRLKGAQNLNGVLIHEIHLIENSERILYPSLFSWIDENNKKASTEKLRRASTLTFNFPDLYRDFIISSIEMPEVSLHNFTNAHLKSNKLLIKHLTLKKEAKLR